MPRLTIKLTQHSPLIHFQSQLENPGIRVTELRPKLDRFLLDKCPQLLESDVVIKGPVNPNNQQEPQSKSLRYKLRFIRTKAQFIEMKRDAYPCFFGNTGVEDEIEKKKLLHFPDGLILEISSDFPKLMECIEKYISEFFVIHSFGNRTSKGFGCFTVISIGGGSQVTENYNWTINEFEQKLKSNISSSPIYKKVIKLKTTNKLELFLKIFKEIDERYKIIKSGVPIKNKRSKIRDYYLRSKTSTEWEKPKLQILIEKVANITLRIESESPNYRFVRALLGLPNQYEYKIKRNNTSIQSTINVNCDSYKITNSKGIVEDFSIERFRSPLQFRIYKNAIYLYKEIEIPEQMFDRSFTFSVTEQGKSSSINLNTPKEPIDWVILFANVFKSGDGGWYEVR